MKAARLALFAATAVVAAGCGSWNPLEWSPLVTLGFKNEPANKPTPLGPINAALTPRAVWSVKVGKSLGYSFRPVYAGGRIYTAAGDGTISLLDEDTGKVVSHIDTKKRVSGGVEVGDGLIVVGTIKGEVLAYDLSGKALWTQSLGGEVIAPAAISNKVVVVRTSDGRIFGLGADDGKRRWVFQRAAPALLLRSESGVLAIGRDVVAGYPNGKLIALDIDDGKLTWEVSVSLPRGATELERIADVAGLPVIDGNNVCAGAFQGKVACFEISSRNMAWSRDLSTSRTVAADKKNLYVVDDSSAVHALDRSQGASVWKQDKLLHRKLTSPVLLDNRLFVGDYQGYLHVLSPDNGELIGRFATDGTAIEWIVPIAGALLVQTAGGTVTMVRI
ncbi:MAG TPA: outer membrane protein assembly factor BamB [Usitatibacter sp.]|nr:outer membrane protein assembly factor BamB [Usitatibacter sp.]